MASGRLSGGTLDKYACVALAGVVTEYLRFGQAEGGVGDVAQLDRLMSALQARCCVLFVCMCVGGGAGGAAGDVAQLDRLMSALQARCCDVCLFRGGRLRGASMREARSCCAPAAAALAAPLHPP